MRSSIRPSRTIARAALRAELALVLALACAACPSPVDPSSSGLGASAIPSATAPAPSQGNKLVVALVVDQLALWLAAERWSQLPDTGGIKRLLSEANAVAELHHGHAHNATAPGHAALFTGAVARESGVTSNGKLDEKGEYGSVLADSSTVVVTGAGKETRPGSSIALLRVPTVADALKQAQPNAKVISLSMKDRGAIFGGGRHPDATLWYDATTDALVTSSAFSDSTPAWAATFTAPGMGAKYRTEVWVPLDPKWLAARTDLPAPDLGQGDFYGLGKKFPHDPAKASKPPKALVATPFADTLLLDAARAAVHELSAQPDPALLSISLSATDYVGHVFGPDAPEAWDQMLRLDLQLAAFLAYLDLTLGPERYAVVLSADHGVSSTPEVMNQGFCGVPGKDRFERRCERALRLQGRDLAKVAESAAGAVMGPGPWVLGVSEPFVLLTPAARALPKDKLDQLIDSMLAPLAAVPGIARAVNARSTAPSCPALEDESLDALLCRSIAPQQEPGVYLMPKQGAFIDTTYVEGDGVNHGTPYLYDRAVPLVVRAPRSDKPHAPLSFEGARVVDQRAYAATLAGLLGVEPPPAAAGGADLSKAKP